jgi:aromatic ring-opening dioxygenase catalytic subunit (LigB family)
MMDPANPPRAIVAISPQWQTEEVMVGSAEQPGFQFDYADLDTEYGGFQCPAGAPDVAARVLELLGEGGVKCKADCEARLADDVVGATSLIFPTVKVPVVSMSILASMSAEDHVRIGNLLQPLSEEGVFFLGIGFSSNSFSLMQVAGDPLVLGAAKLFKEHLDRLVTGQNCVKSTESLLKWESLPAAQFNHQTAEHLTPLMVVAAAAGNTRANTVDASFVGVPLSNYVFA